MYEDFIPERLAKLRMQKGVSARDMSLSLGPVSYTHLDVYKRQLFIREIHIWNPP